MGLLDSIMGSLTGGAGGAGGSSLLPALMNIMASRAGGGAAAGGYQDNSATGGAGGGIGGMIGDMLGGGGGQGGAAGGLGGGAIASGLGQLLQQFQQSGHGDIANSWVGNGQNQPIAPDQVGQALGHDTIDQLSQQTGMAHGDIMSQLSQMLPQIVNQFTPNGRVPTASEAEQNG